MLDAQQGFGCGVARLIAKLFELGIVRERDGMLPAREANDEACAKLPADIVRQLHVHSHRNEYGTNGRTFHGLKVLIPDGTKVSFADTQPTRDKYGAGQGHYVQSQALGFYELSTGTFEDFRFEHCNTPERAIAIGHMGSNATRSLYMADAGYNGMAFIAISMDKNHELLMPLKNCALAKKFLKAKKRSAVIGIKLSKIHLANYPGHHHLLGTCIKVRLIRTRGTSKLRSQVLITTLIDEVVFGWREVTKLYLQRYCVELAFRHLKTRIGIERIRKRKLLRIEQLLFAAIVLFNLSAALRNRIRRPSLLPEKAGIKLHCFTLCIELVHTFLQAALGPRRGIRKKMDSSLRAIRGCWFIYKPWRAEPRICRTPPSEFSVQKGAEMLTEVETAKFLSVEYEILAQQYGQRE
ncbi:transposase [Pontiella sulfatireligans]|nr:transposase [Pontiella sulfatireligans]